VIAQLLLYNWKVLHVVNKRKKHVEDPAQMIMSVEVNSVVTVSRLKISS
jgi:hypothetical protein